ncbi:MAG: ATP-binding protein [Candidatus Methylophosphatis roskildensis]
MPDVLRPGAPVPRLFLYDLSRGKTEAPHWFASIVWGDEPSNPWYYGHPDHPRIGALVSGTAVRYGNEQNVVIRLDSGLEGWLNLGAVPAHGNPPKYYQTIQEAVHIGDHLQVTIVAVDPSRCKVELSVCQALIVFESYWRNKPIPPSTRKIIDSKQLVIRDADQRLSVTRDDATAGDTQSPWQGKRILLIENDVELARDLLPWLEAMGATAWHADNGEHARQVCNDETKAVTHVLSDYHLGGRQERAAVLNLLRSVKKRVLVALASGFYEEASREAGRLGMDFLPKPLSFADLDAWLAQGKCPPFNAKHYKPAEFWQNRLAIEDIAARGSQVLARLCERTGAMAGLWVRRERSEWYRVVAHAGLDDTARQRLVGVERKLAQTLADDIIDKEGRPTTRARAIAAAGALRDVAPSHCAGIVGIGAPDNGGILLFVVEDSSPNVKRLDAFLAQHQETLKDFAAWLGDLTTLGDIADHAREEFDFAAHGRASAAILHELRHYLHLFAQDTRPPSLIEKARREEGVEEARRLWASYWQRGKDAARLVGAGLFSIRAERSREVSLADRIETIGSHFVWPMAERNKVTVILNLPARDLRLHLPPEVVDQPLLNLLDNAIYYSRGRPWSRVELEVKVDARDTNAPVAIEVRDQGVGMTVEQKERLFSPRFSAKGTKGHGMGLYIAQKLVTAVGGEIRCVRSERWFGSTFQVRLPLALGKPGQRVAEFAP